MIFCSERSGKETRVVGSYSDRSSVETRVARSCSDRSSVETRVVGSCSDRSSVETRVARSCSDGSSVETKGASSCSDGSGEETRVASSSQAEAKYAPKFTHSPLLVYYSPIFPLLFYNNWLKSSAFRQLKVVVRGTYVDWSCSGTL